MFQVSYEESTQTLIVTVVECNDLKKMDIIGKSDPFVQLFLMPGNHSLMKTKVIKKTLNPVFYEEFKFLVSKNYSSVQKKTIVLRVFDQDKFSKTDPIGEVIQRVFLYIIYKCFCTSKVQIHLWLVNLSSITNEWKDLHKLSGTKEKVGMTRNIPHWFYF